MNNPSQWLKKFSKNPEPYRQPELVRNSANAFKKPKDGWADPRIEVIFKPDPPPIWRIAVSSVVGCLVVIVAGVGGYCWYRRRRAARAARAANDVAQNPSAELPELPGDTNPVLEK
ncbi:hypothetical protein K440DRAFT_625194 [Wilcoxina mikolae CBS 423.85]|nr:hypothetical protein K440DRAFT_625194 [Wilcoxina mikolae CBS 423.85]